jgi:hypothetical protein
VCESALVKFIYTRRGSDSCSRACIEGEDAAEIPARVSSDQPVITCFRSVCYQYRAKTAASKSQIFHAFSCYWILMLTFFTSLSSFAIDHSFTGYNVPLPLRQQSRPQETGYIWAGQFRSLDYLDHRFTSRLSICQHKLRINLTGFFNGNIDWLFVLSLAIPSKTNNLCSNTRGLSLIEG